MSIAIIGSGAIGRALATRFARRAMAVSITTDLRGRPSTQVVGELLHAPRVVKAFNTLPAALLAADPEVSEGRRVLFLSGDDASANAEISALIEKLGFAPVDLGKLSEGGRLQQFGGALTGKNLVQHPVPGR
jgi:8-hydroxy-5-deazaflavin:NADPH oxidoreductase